MLNRRTSILSVTIFYCVIFASPGLAEKSVEVAKLPESTVWKAGDDSYASKQPFSTGATIKWRLEKLPDKLKKAKLVFLDGENKELNGNAHWIFVGEQQVESIKVSATTFLKCSISIERVRNSLSKTPETILLQPTAAVNKIDYDTLNFVDPDGSDKKTDADIAVIDLKYSKPEF